MQRITNARRVGRIIGIIFVRHLEWGILFHGVRSSGAGSTAARSGRTRGK